MESKPHAVWIKVPTMDPEVHGRYRTRRDAERIAPALEKRAKKAGWMADFGPCEVWIESPGSIEEKLRKLSESYEEG